MHWSMDNKFKVFKGLAILAAAATYIQIIAGATVRTSGSGLGCSTWPDCKAGSILPPLQIHAIIEFTHRVWGSITGLLILSMCIAAWIVVKKVGKGVPVVASIATILVGIEGILGGLAVIMQLPRNIVAVHLINAFLIFGLTTYVAVRTIDGNRILQKVKEVERNSIAAYGRFTSLALICTFILLVSGALVVANDAGEACFSWPFCNGGFSVIGNFKVTLEVIHRSIAGLVILLDIVVSLVGITQFKNIRYIVWGAVCLALLGLIEIAVGASLAILKEPDALKGLHVALAGAVWGAAVFLFSVTYYGWNTLKSAESVVEIAQL